ncbi:MAG: hypothetical protein RIS88_122 [Pseudomonadota bacterium]
MRILVLSKRQYTGKDLLDDQYGRLYELPVALKSRGHQVIGITLSYRRRTEGWHRSGKATGSKERYHVVSNTSGKITSESGNTGVDWLSINALPWGVWNYIKQLTKITSEFRPDVVWACSDAFHAISGALYSKATNVPLVIDLYDNFESFPATHLPGIAPAFRAACRHAVGLTVVSHSLSNHVVSKYKSKARVKVVINGVDQEIFYPRNREQARRTLGLPLDVQLIGTAGAISSDREIGLLFEAFLNLAESNPDLHLVWAGRDDGTPALYDHPRIISLGALPHDRVPHLFSALDVAVVCNRDTPFGRHCFPQKLSEIIATEIPFVSARLGDAARLLKNHPHCLYEPGNLEDLIYKTKRQLTNPHAITDIHIPSWTDLGLLAEDMFEKVIRKT